jgi:glutaredoxin-related protein
VTSKEKRLAAALLKMAADEFGGHICNDFDLTRFGFTEDECRELMREFHDWNGDPQIFLDDVANGRKFAQTQDFVVMSFMAEKLEQEAKGS